MLEQIEVDGRMRTFTVVGERRPGQALVLVFHGSRQSGEIHRAFTGGAYDALADRGALVAYLDGYRGNWNDARRESRFPARLAGIDDVAFANGPVLLAKVEAAWSAQAPQPIADHDDDEGVSRLGR